MRGAVFSLTSGFFGGQDLLFLDPSSAAASSRQSADAARLFSQRWDSATGNLVILATTQLERYLLALEMLSFATLAPLRRRVGVEFYLLTPTGCKTNVLQAFVDVVPVNASGLVPPGEASRGGASPAPGVGVGVGVGGASPAPSSAVARGPTPAASLVIHALLLLCAALLVGSGRR